MKPSFQMHKGQYGKPLLIVGSSQYHGAAILSSQAALISGSDYVYLLTHGDKYQVISQSSPCIITSKFEDKNNIIEQFKQINISTITIGCGLGRSQESELMLQQALQLQSIKNIPMIIDADAIFLLSNQIQQYHQQLNKQILLTPNSREFDLLYYSLFNKHSVYFNTKEILEKDNQKIYFDLQKAAQDIIQVCNKLNCNVLVKFIVDIVSDGQNIYYTQSHGQPKRSSGQGDILAGILSCFLNTQDNLCKNAACASQLCKISAIQAFQENYICTTAVDILKQIKYQLIQFKEDIQEQFILKF